MTAAAIQRRQEFNRRRLADNARNESLTGVQHAALYILSKYRHDAHCNAGKFYDDSTLEAKRFRNFVRGPMGTMLRTVNLPELDLSQFMVMPDKDFVSSIGLDAGYESLARATCLAQMEKLNCAIESYLRNIDRSFGTWYAPTGGQRDASVKRGGQYEQIRT